VKPIKCKNTDFIKTQYKASLAMTSKKQSLLNSNLQANITTEMCSMKKIRELEIWFKVMQLKKVG